jgi:uncharacterized protein (TIGR00290 family)
VAGIVSRRPVRAWLWWSSGKDSAWALHLLRQAGDVAVERLVTTLTPAFDRVAIHGTRRDVLAAQADAAGIPLRSIELPQPCPNDAYEAAVRPVLAEAAARGVDAMVFGDIALADVRAYRERLLGGTGIDAVFPLWESDATELARAMVAGGLEAVVTCLDPQRLARDCAGACFDTAFLARLPHGVDPCGENGEFHTCVTAGPMFSRSLFVHIAEIVERDGFVYADLALDD